jgi:hypothetical protein
VDIVSQLGEALTPQPETWIGVARVTNASAGTFPDGRRKITVDWQGTSIDTAYNAAYTPALDDWVTFLKADSSYWVVGKSA